MTLRPVLQRGRKVATKRLREKKLIRNRIQEPLLLSAGTKVKTIASPVLLALVSALRGRSFSPFSNQAFGCLWGLLCQGPRPKWPWKSSGSFARQIVDQAISIEVKDEASSRRSTPLPFPLFLSLSLPLLFPLLSLSRIYSEPLKNLLLISPIPSTRQSLSP